MTTRLIRYREEMFSELGAILDYWMQHTPDHDHGGFIGRIDHQNNIYREAAKGSVLNSRILWSFSAAFQLTGDTRYFSMAERSFEALSKNFFDKKYGGVFWTTDHKGVPLDTKKQIYALSFAVYGLSEYGKCAAVGEAKQLAIQLYKDIITHSRDVKNAGYIEALSRDWKELHDLRLSDKDANEPKSMNTHLHVLEGFANLYRVWPEEELAKNLREVVNIFLGHIISNENGHLRLFFDDEWNSRSDLISYGHDIEAAWLVQEAAELLDDHELMEAVKKASLILTGAAMEGLDTDGGLWYEYDPSTNHLVKEKHSWPQAEAMIGFFNAWQLTGSEKYLDQSIKSWDFVKNYLHDKKWGEWYWGVHENYAPMSAEDKVGIWKCPYHNSRACIEIIQRINTLID